MNDNQVYDIAKMLGALDAKVDALHEDVKQIHRYEKRLGRVEGDVRTIRKVFGGLFSALLVAGTAAVTWLKG